MRVIYGIYSLYIRSTYSVYTFYIFSLYLVDTPDGLPQIIVAAGSADSLHQFQ
ncbi:hypothetical protein BIFADO_01834 [Bifidobacterium adolescentis L2-32]|uniref:Uncharacterized protein n=1 Tax=Bifidobacterium adolescentis L2-32 TaxID=411481 RepID=A7A7J5_BIFAD|nr:hypothetical protein BIFADO_01834 [Bifidobacterium adolescentis L2-32]